jgi:hypothetical protein
MNQKQAKRIRQLVRKMHPDLPEMESDNRWTPPQFIYNTDKFRFQKVAKGRPFRYAESCQKFLINMTKKARKADKQSVDFMIRLYSAATQ